MKKKLLSILALFCLTVASAWAQSLYLDVNGTSATLKYGNAGSKPYYDEMYDSWKNLSGTSEKTTVQTITVDATTCKDFQGVSFRSLFEGFTALTSVDLSGLYTLDVSNMSHMFDGCSSLRTLDLSSLETYNVSSMTEMFDGCSSLVSVDLSSINTNTTTSTALSRLFRNCSSLTAIFVGDGWKTTSNDAHMFTGCTNLPNWDGTENGSKANTGPDGYLNKVKVTANEGETGEFWATYYNEYKNLIAPTGTQVFKVALSGTALTMNKIADGIITKGQGVVLKGASNSIVLNVNTTASEDGYSGNSLQGTMTSIPNPGNAYMLNYKEATGAGFYKLKATGTIGANKAYLTYDGNVGSRDFFVFDEATGIEQTEAEEGVEDGVIYDLQGREVENPAPGIYIVNGKKVFIK